MTEHCAVKIGGVKLWSTMLFSSHWPGMEMHADALKLHIRAQQQQQKENIASRIAVESKSPNGILESDFDFFRDTHPSVQSLLSFIKSVLATSVSIANEMPNREPELLIDIVESWYHITNDGGFHDAHFHHGCSWCGIFYLQVGETGRLGKAAPNGGSRFYCPLGLGGGYRDEGNRYLNSSVDPKIQDGLLLLFPSFLMHSGLPYRGAADRIVIAFNARVQLREQLVK